MIAERFECVRRGGRHIRLAQCFADFRIAKSPCDGCLVGAQHAELEPARTWPNGDRLRWIGELPIELERVVERHVKPAKRAAKARAPKPEAAPPLRVVWYAAGVEIDASTDPGVWAEIFRRSQEG